MATRRSKLFTMRISEEEMEFWRDAATEQGYTNLSDFIRDAVSEKIEIWQENQTEWELEQESFWND